MKKSPPDNSDIAIVYSDDALVVVDKPGGLATVRRKNEPVTLGELLAEKGLVESGGWPPICPVDAGATGLTLYARTAIARGALQKAAEDGQIAVEVFALVSGYVAADGVVDLAIQFDKKKNTIQLSDSGDPARTEYFIERRLAGHTLLRCRATTHRDQQFRLHLASIGHPLAVDPEIGGGTAVYLSHFKPGYRPSKKHEERPLIARLSMHVFQLTINHPFESQEIELDCESPKDLRATVNQLERLATRS